MQVLPYSRLLLPAWCRSNSELGPVLQAWVLCAFAIHALLEQALDVAYVAQALDVLYVA